MSSSEIRGLIEVQASTLAPVLYAGMATSLAKAQDRNQGLPYEKYPWSLPMVLRAEMREYLEANPPIDWHITGDPRMMGQLCLEHPNLNMEMRFLKERRRSYPGGVPSAGSNRARRKVWTQDPLDKVMFDVAAPASTPVRLLLLWDFMSPEARNDFRLRIVHTLGAGVYGQVVPCDLILDIHHGGSVYSHLQFDGSTEEEDFFIEIAEEERGS
jgi:hypothetical protein